MKLKEINDAVAAACNVRANVVSAVQAETFKQILAALQKGEKVAIPDFGMFVVKDVAGEGGAGAKKIIRFRERSAGDDEEKKAKRAEKKKAKEAGGGKPEAGDDDED